MCSFVYISDHSVISWLGNLPPPNALLNPYFGGGGTLGWLAMIIDIGQFRFSESFSLCIPKLHHGWPKAAIEKKITDFVQSKLDPKEGTEAWSTIARMSPG